MRAGRWGGYIAKDGSFCDFKQETRPRSPTSGNMTKCVDLLCYVKNNNYLCKV